MKVQLFIPCFVDQLYPQTAFSMIKVLEKACCDVEYNANQTCCGQPAFNSGFFDETTRVMYAVDSFGAVLPEGEDWNAVLELRDQVRAEIAKHCGEPDLA